MTRRVRYQWALAVAGVVAATVAAEVSRDAAALDVIDGDRREGPVPVFR